MKLVCFNSFSECQGEKLGEVSTSLKTVWPTWIASEAFQRYFQPTLNAMAQKCWVKGKVAKILYVLSHFLLFFFLPGVWMMGVSETTAGEVSCWEKSCSTSHPSPSLQKALLEFILRGLAVTLILAVQEAEFWGGWGWGDVSHFTHGSKA